MLVTLFGRKKPPVAKGVHIYFSQAGIIVAALHQNFAGIVFEQKDARYIEGRPDAIQLGAAFREVFDRFSFKERDLRGAKKTEWPAFLASKLRSVKHFETSYHLMGCMSVNSSNSVVRAEIAHPAIDGIQLSLTFAPLLPPQTVGEQLLKLISLYEADCPPRDSSS
jgi:hypothetical protein